MLESPRASRKRMIARKRMLIFNMCDPGRLNLHIIIRSLRGECWLPGMMKELLECGGSDTLLNFIMRLILRELLGGLYLQSFSGSMALLSGFFGV
jgi:hypothetical protein